MQEISVILKKLNEEYSLVYKKIVLNSLKAVIIYNAKYINKFALLV